MRLNRTIDLDHLAPIARALGPDARMLVTSDDLVARAIERGVLAQRGVPRLPDGPPVLVAGYRDANATAMARRLALLEHGVGQTYVDGEAADSMGYAGGQGWERASLILTPGPHATERWRARYPYLRVEEVGCPKLDELLDCRREQAVSSTTVGAPPPSPGSGNDDGRRAAAAPGSEPTVAFTFHWKCKQTGETWPAFDDWKGQLARLPHDTYEVLGHWHPRWGGELATWYERWDIERVATADEVMRRSDLLVADNTSLLYEFAATDRPVLCLNAERYRRDVEHGLRFWSHPPGPMLDLGDDLEENIAGALAAPDSNAQMGLRNAAVARVYGDTLDGNATERAVEALRAWA